MSIFFNALAIIRRHKHDIVTRKQQKGGNIRTNRETYVALREFANVRGYSISTMLIILVNLGMLLYVESERALTHYRKRKEEALKANKQPFYSSE